MSTSDDDNDERLAEQPGGPPSGEQAESQGDAPIAEGAVAMRRAMSMIASVGNPILGKVEGSHITQVLDLGVKSAARQRTSER